MELFERFESQLKAAPKTIVFTEGTDARILSAASRLLAGGIMELLIGLMLMIYPSVSAATLPFFLAFWLMFRSLGLIGTGSDLMSLKVPGGLWTIIVGSLLLLCSVLILVHPILFGVEAVVIWVGISFLMAGISLSVLAFELKSLHKHFSE